MVKGCKVGRKQVGTMSKIYTAVFGTVLLGAVVGLDYFNHLQQNRALDGMGLGPQASYVESVSQRLGLTFAAANAAAVPEGQDLAAALPPAPEDWTRAPYVAADGEAVTGHVFRPTMLNTNATNEVLRKLVKPLQASSSVTETYARGDERVIVLVTYRAPQSDKSFTGNIAADVEGKLSGFSLGGPLPAYGTVQGVSFRQLAMTDRDIDTGKEFPLAYRRIKADLGRAVEVLIVTNADDAAVQPILTGLDLPKLARIAGIADGLVRADLAPVWGEAASTGVDETAATRTVAEAEAAGESAAAAAPDSGTGVCVRRAGLLTCD